MERGKEGRKETREGGRKELCRNDGRQELCRKDGRKELCRKDGRKEGRKEGTM